MAVPLTPSALPAPRDKTYHVAVGRHAPDPTRVDARLTQGGESPPRQPFNVIFRGPPDDVLAESMYA